MTIFDISVHKNVMFQILKDIYSDTTISSFLGFKGGTAALMFYKLDRFSVDLDFDLLDDSKENYVFDRVEKIAQKYGVVKESAKKRFNLFLMISYKVGVPQIKIEINRRSSGSKYELKTYLGISMLAMVCEDMFAHKLVAMNERVGKTSRDIYDVWFFLKNNFPINEKIVELRTGVLFRKFILKCVSQLEKMNDRNILDGLGELLTPAQKDWARAKLRTDTIFLLKLRLETDRHTLGNL